MTAHELGHQFGIDDLLQNDPAYRPGSLMAFPLGDRVFELRDQVIIRSQAASPGTRGLQK